ncbi:MAG: hypothetical protein ACRC33_15310 [Gemmataceae bacterium]
MAIKSPSPLLALTLGLVTLLASAAVARIDGLPLAREVTLFAGTGLLLCAVVTRLRTAGWDWRDRAETAAYLASAALIAAGMALSGINPAWGSARLLLGAGSVLGFGATALVLLPPVPRKVLLSLWIVFHFGGMFTSFSSIDPPGSQGPFLSKHLWAFVYRPYLQFLYLTNAYHFYSPDPGAPNLLWFAVHYSDGSYLWVRIPSREKGQIGMHYQRLLALPEHSFTQKPGWPLTKAAVAGLRTDLYDEDRLWDNINERRVRGSGVRYRNPETKRSSFIPLLADIDVSVQYREPTDNHKRMIASVAHRMLRVAPKREGLEVRSVKVYRVTHNLLTPYELSRGVSPFIKSKYWPYFLGEFNADGEMVNPLDPFLYWYVPILLVPTNYPDHGLREPKFNVPMIAAAGPAAEPNFELNGLEMHAAGPVEEKTR